jgi:ABC-2 type transport system permease protein
MTDVIHDIGYRHYDGPRLDRGRIRLALLVDGLRGAYGFGRAARSKVMPILLLVLMTVPALIVVVVATLTQADSLPISEVAYPVYFQTVLALFVAAQAPAVISRDLRYRTIPLYLSRPMTRVDYVQARYGALAGAVFLFVAIPQLILFAGALLAKLPPGSAALDLLQGLFAALLHAVVLSGLALVIASVTTRRGLGVAAIMGTYFLLGTAVIVLQGITVGTGRDRLAGWVAIGNPVSLVDGVVTSLFDLRVTGPANPPGTLAGVVFTLALLAVVAGSYGLLVRRYRGVLS